MSLSIQRIKALLKKETYQILRDPSALWIAVFLPLLLLFLYGYGVSLDLDHLRVGVVLEDSEPPAQTFLASLQDSRYFDVTVARNRQPLYEQLERGEIRGIIVIPSYFSEFLQNPNKIAPIQVIGDGSETNTANFLQYYVKGAYQNWQLQETISHGMQKRRQAAIQARVWYNEPVESRYFLLSGSLAITMTLIGTLLTALVIAREWERGTMESMISTSVTRLEIILGKAIPYFLLGMISMALCVTCSVLFFDLPFQGSLGALVLTSSAFLFCAMGLGLMISTLSKQQALAYQIAMVTGFLPAYILSGFLFEIYSMPKWIQWITYVIPARYFVQTLQTLFLVGDVWILIFKNIIPMILIGIFFFFITIHKTAKRID